MKVFHRVRHTLTQLFRRRPARLAAFSAALLLTIALAVYWSHASRANTVDYTRVYRIGYGDDVPYHFKGPDGRPAGLAADMIKEAARRRGIRLEWIMPSVSGIPAIQSGEIDLWVLMTIRPERRLQIYLTEPYLETDTIFVVPDRGDQSPSLEQLKNKRISLLNYDSHIRSVKSVLPGAAIVPAASTLEAITAIEDGRADAAFIDQVPSIGAILGKSRRTPFRMLGAGLPRSYLALASSFNTRGVADEIRSELRSLEQDGTLFQFANRWGLFAQLSTDVIGSREKTRRQVVMLRSGLSILGVALLAIGLLAWRLRRQRNVLETQGRRLRASEERWHLALRGSNDGIFDYDAIAGRTYFSNRWREMLGYLDGGQTGARSWSDLVHPEDLARSKDEIKAHLKHETELLSSEFRVRTKSGGYRWILCRARALWDDAGNPVRLVGSYTDITPRKELEQHLREAQSRAEAANTAKSQFLMNMSHEIRTPMNAILGIAELLARCNNDGERQEYIGQITASGQSLVELLTQILDLSKIEANQLELERVPFSLRECLLAVEGLFSAAAAQQRIPLRIEGLPSASHDLFYGDPLRLRQVLFNLVGNALKFTEEGSILVRVCATPAGDCHSRLLFEVIDTGMGIPPDKIGRIFNTFEQGDSSTTRKHGGSGLGLAICHHLVQLMGGELRVESEPNKGSRFYFAFDLEQAPAAAADAALPRDLAQLEDPFPPGQAAATNPLRILVAEDNLVNQIVIRKILERLGHAVSIAADGLEAAVLASKQEFDLILMDVHMPIRNGLEATIEIRAAEARKGSIPIPIFALSAAVFETDRQACLRAGMDGFLSKPIELPSLRRTLDRVSRLSRHRVAPTTH